MSPFQVRVRDGRGQHVERGGLGDGAGEQVALSGVDVGILVRVLVDQRRRIPADKETASLTSVALARWMSLSRR